MFFFVFFLPRVLYKFPRQWWRNINQTQWLISPNELNKSQQRGYFAVTQLRLSRPKQSAANKILSKVPPCYFSIKHLVLLLPRCVHLYFPSVF